MNQETVNLRDNYSQLCGLRIDSQTDVAQRVSRQLHSRCPGYYSDWSDNGNLYTCRCPHHGGIGRSAGDPDGDPDPAGNEGVNA